jgi:NTP pyrophosphatase (non-canonical NTP hydrolase)
MTNFDKVVDFNTQFGVLESDKLVPQLDVFDKDPKKIEFCLKLIREEMKELETAVENKDYIETVDALADLTYVIFGMSSRIGMNMDLAFNLVHDNNMSKLCKTEEEAQKTVKYYEDNKSKLGYDTPKYRKAPDGIHWVVYNESTKKILKSIEWKPVDLTILVKTH